MNHEQGCLFPSGNQHNHSGANALCLSALMADTKVQKRLVNWLASQGQWAKETDSHPSCLTPRSKLLVNVLYFLGQETSSLSILPPPPRPAPISSQNHFSFFQILTTHWISFVEFTSSNVLLLSFMQGMHLSYKTGAWRPNLFPIPWCFP